MDKQVFIVGACRTPVGSFQGQFSKVPAFKLGGIVIQHALERAKISPSDVSEVIMGQVLTAGQGQNPARQAALEGKVPASVPAHTVNMVCGSGLRTVYDAYNAIKAGEARIVVAGGQENMTLANHCGYLRGGLKIGSLNMEDTILTDGLTDAMLKLHMGKTAEYLAREYNISRADQDEFAYNSHMKAAEAIRSGYFHDEIVCLENPLSGMEIKIDQHCRPNTTIESLGALRPAFDTAGTVTAGNSSGVNDGAAALVLCSGLEVKNRGLTPLGRIVACSQVGLDPLEMGLGPVSAIRLVLEKASWNIEDVDIFEINEAFAAQSLAVILSLNLDLDKVNVTGGAIALGHPIGASGARVLVTLLHNMKRTKKIKGIAAVCIGGGMGIAIAVQIV